MGAVSLGRARRGSIRGALALVALGCSCACASRLSSHRLIGAPRAPVSAADVQIYLETPKGAYDQIAVLDASSQRAFAFSYEAKAEVVIRRLKQEAAKVGANGVLLRGISDESGGAVGTDVGSYYEGPRGTIDLGFGATAVMLSRHGSGIAIYLKPE
jgi:hypothetical protein